MYWNYIILQGDLIDTSAKTKSLIMGHSLVVHLAQIADGKRSFLYLTSCILLVLWNMRPTNDVLDGWLQTVNAGSRLNKIIVGYLDLICMFCITVKKKLCQAKAR